MLKIKYLLSNPVTHTLLLLFNVITQSSESSIALFREDSFLKTMYAVLNPFVLENVTDSMCPQRSVNAYFRQSVVAYGGTFNTKRVRFLGYSASWFLMECSLKNSWCLSELSASKRIHNATIQNNLILTLQDVFLRCISDLLLKPLAPCLLAFVTIFKASLLYTNLKYI